MTIVFWRDYCQDFRFRLPKQYGNKPPRIFHLIPEKYSNTKTCGILPVKVEKGKTNIFDFDLSTK
ncbi:MAG: hypothetical protein LBL62_10445 [Planctomycetaceae bacterium]|nr:hypothetical protein [Planctomycetaceae bacterium]